MKKRPSPKKDAPAPTTYQQPLAIVRALDALDEGVHCLNVALGLLEGHNCDPGDGPEDRGGYDLRILSDVLRATRDLLHKSAVAAAAVDLPAAEQA